MTLCRDVLVSILSNIDQCVAEVCGLPNQQFLISNMNPDCSLLSPRVYAHPIKPINIDVHSS